MRVKYARDYCTVVVYDTQMLCDTAVSSLVVSSVGNYPFFPLVAFTVGMGIYSTVRTYSTVVRYGRFIAKVPLYRYSRLCHSLLYVLQYVDNSGVYSTSTVGVKYSTVLRGMRENAISALFH